LQATLLRFRRAKPARCVARASSPCCPRDSSGVRAGMAGAQVRIDLSHSFHFIAGESYALGLHDGLRSVVKTSAAEQGRVARFMLRSPTVAFLARTTSTPPVERHRVALESANKTRGGMNLMAFQLLSCNSAQTTAVNNAASAARAAVQNIVQNYFYNGCLDTDFTTYFGAYDQNRYIAVRTHFINMFSLVSGEARSNSAASTLPLAAFALGAHPRTRRMSGTLGGGAGGFWYSFNCAPSATDCGSASTFAFVYPNDSEYTISLCNAFWSGPAGVVLSDSQGGTIIHEMSHFLSIGATRPRSACVCSLSGA
jgi:hypothetical protein